MNSIIINQIAILTLLMIVGIALRKFKIVDDHISKGMSNILINVALPCLILNSFNIKFSKELVKNSIIIFLCSVGIHILLIILSQLSYFKFDKDKSSVFKFSTVFSNCGFVGYPIAQGVFGNLGVFYTSIFTIPFNLFMWTYGVILFTGEKNLKAVKKNLVNPPLICIFIGLILFIFSIKLPSPITATLSSIGAMTTPLSMFIIGGMLADVNVKNVFTRLDIYYLNFIKLIAAPLLVYIILSTLNINNTVIRICVIMVAMPAASLVGVFTEKYGGDNNTASACAFLTTILSLFTIPVIMYFCK